MAKSLEELDLIFKEQYPKVAKKQKPKRDLKNKEKRVITKQATKTASEEDSEEDVILVSIWDILFYGLLVFMVAGAIFFSRESIGNRSIGGRHFYEVATTSMQSVYPKGSLVFVEEIEPSQLMVGDDIVFRNGVNERMTSRITAIEDNYKDTGERAFETAGIDKKNDNSKEVLADKVVGKVTGSIPIVGGILTWISGNIWIVFVIFGLLIVVSICTKILEGKRRKSKAR